MYAHITSADLRKVHADNQAAVEAANRALAVLAENGKTALEQLETASLVEDAALWADKLVGAANKSSGGFMATLNVAFEPRTKLLAESADIDAMESALLMDLCATLNVQMPRKLSLVKEATQLGETLVGYADAYEGAQSRQLYKGVIRNGRIYSAFLGENVAESLPALIEKVDLILNAAGYPEPLLYKIVENFTREPSDSFEACQTVEHPNFTITKDANNYFVLTFEAHIRAAVKAKVCDYEALVDADAQIEACMLEQFKLAAQAYAKGFLTKDDCYLSQLEKLVA